MQAPATTVNNLVDAINQGDLARAVGLYEKDAVLVAEPGKVARGRTELEAALAGFIAMKGKLHSEAQQVVETGDIALYISRWTLNGTGPDGKPISLAGESTDILHRQSDGRWLIALDNPWGTSILPKSD